MGSRKGRYSPCLAKFLAMHRSFIAENIRLHFLNPANRLSPFVQCYCRAIRSRVEALGGPRRETEIKFAKRINQLLDTTSTQSLSNKVTHSEIAAETSPPFLLKQSSKSALFACVRTSLIIANFSPSTSRSLAVCGVMGRAC